MSANVGHRLPMYRLDRGRLDHRGAELPGSRSAFASTDEMLEPDVLASVLGRPVAHVRRAPRSVEGSTTDATFESIYLDGEPRPSLIAKTVERDRDWVAIATHDRVDREVRTWESGILARLPAPATHAVVACARTDIGYTILMRDVSDLLLPNDPQADLPDEYQELAMRALASMHASFWMDPMLTDPSHGLATLSSFISHGAPRTVKRIQVRMGRTGFTDWLEEGWDRLPSAVDPQLAEDLRAIADDPTLIVQAMADQPWTLVHSDPRPANLALDPGTRSVIFLDWARPAVAPPAIDLMYWLFTANHVAPGPRGDLIETYEVALRSRLGSRFSSAWWEPQLDLCALAFVACFAPIMANISSEAIGGWAGRCLAALRRLG